MRVMLILCHPDSRSYNHALADRASRVLVAAGHDVRSHDLYAEAVDPVLTIEELRRGYSFDEQIQGYSGELSEAGGLVFVHPDWWGGPPALLKGWIDRVFRPGIAYEWEGEEFLPKDKSPLLGDKRAVVFATTDSEGAPSLELFWKDAVFGFCGLRRVTIEIFGPLRDSPPARRRSWLEEVERATLAAFT